MRNSPIAGADFSLGIVLAIAAIAALTYFLLQRPGLLAAVSERGPAAVAAGFFRQPRVLSAPWVFTFNASGTLNEASSPRLSTSPYWWLSSGGVLIIEDGIGRTNIDAMPPQSRWSRLYRASNPLDTDSGRYPQNLFRLVSQDLSGDSDASMSFRIVDTNLTDTPNRDGYSGVFLFSRYQDSDNLYYAGVRQDGRAVIKKKIEGVYYTLGETELFKSARPYDRASNPDLIPAQSWQRLRLVTQNEKSGVRLVLYYSPTPGGRWQEALSALDAGVGGRSFMDPGRFGIRSDYMDMEFDTFRVEPL